MPQSAAQIAERSCWSLILSSLGFICLYCRQSSANNLTCDFTDNGRSSPSTITFFLSTVIRMMQSDLGYFRNLAKSCLCELCRLLCRIVTSVWMFWSMPWTRSWSVIRSRLSHERFVLNPCWRSERMLLVLRWFKRCLQIMCLRVLQQTLVNEIGQYFVASCLFPFLCIGATLTFHQLAGIIPLSRLFWALTL